jgi:hypothetical protein
MRRFRMVIVQVRSQMVSKDDVSGHGCFQKLLLHAHSGDGDRLFRRMATTYSDR